MTKEVARMIGSLDLLKMARKLETQGQYKQAAEFRELALAVLQNRCY